MGKVDESEAIGKMQQVLNSKACGVKSAKKLGTARSSYSARDSGVSDHLGTQNLLILDNSENEHGPLYNQRVRPFLNSAFAIRKHAELRKVHVQPQAS